MNISRRYLVALFVAAGVAVSYSGQHLSLFPAGGDTALHQQVRDLSNDMNVLSVAIQPGYEDLALLAYFRMAKGAKILSAYITNGEAGESDLGWAYPVALAATRREEAVAAMSVLDGETRFLNFPDIAAASDSARVRRDWPADSLQMRLRILIDEFKPDLILVCHDFGFTGSRLRTDIVAHDVLEAVHQSSKERGWHVARVAVGSVRDSGLLPSLDEKHPVLAITYKMIAERAALAYKSLAAQRASWATETPAYRVIHPETFVEPSLDAGFPASFSGLKTLAAKIDDLSKKTLKSGTKNGQRFLGLLVSLMDSVDFRIARIHLHDAAQRRLLLKWKAGLEGLRNILLGVKVNFTVSDTILTNRQLTYLTIKTVEGISGEGKTDIFVPAVDTGWLLNEGIERRLPLQTGEAYRLVTPENTEYNYPHAEYGLSQTTVRKPTYFFIIHQATDRTKSFVHRSSIHFSFAPKLSVEVLTPVVRAMTGDEVVVRLMNHSRDGVRDTVYVRDSVLYAPGRAFRLSHKEAAQVDTLRLHLHVESPPAWDHLAQVLIADMPQGMFVARNVAVATNTQRRVAVIPGMDQSPTLEALRRISQPAQRIRPEDISASALAQIDVLILDRRVLLFHPQFKSRRRVLERFVEQGGHLVVLAQEGENLSDIPFLEGIEARPSWQVDEATPVVLDTLHTLLNAPNNITVQDFDGWIYRMAHNKLIISESRGFQIPIAVAESGDPLLVTRKVEAGRVTYVDLAFHHQWLNVHPGSLRLLANIVSYSD